MALPANHYCANLPQTLCLNRPRSFGADFVLLYSYFTSIFVSLGVFLFGYDQGVMSGILTYVTISGSPRGSARQARAVSAFLTSAQRPSLHRLLRPSVQGSHWDHGCDS